MPSGPEVTGAVAEAEVDPAHRRDEASDATPMVTTATEPGPREPWLARVGWWATVVAVALVPVLFLRVGTNVFGLPKLTLLWVCTLLGTAGVLVRWAGGVPRPRLPVVAVPAFALVVVVGIATAVSERPWVALMGRYGRHAGLISLVTYVVFGAVVFASCCGRPDRLLLLARAVAAGGVIGAVVVLLQVVGVDFDWSTTIGAQLPYQGHMGALGNSNFAGAHLAMTIPVFLMLRVAEPTRRARVAATVAIPFVAVALATTGTRGAWIAAVVGASVAMLMNRRFAPRWLAAVMTVLAVVGVGSVIVIAITRGDSTFRPIEPQSVLRRQTLEQRVDLWVAAVDIARDHPVVGTGPDTFAQEVLGHAESAPDLTHRPEAFDAPHNILLAHLSSAGFLGAAAWLAVMITAWVTALRARKAIHGLPLALAAAFGGGLAAYLAQGLVSIDVVPLAFLGWFLLAALSTAVASGPTSEPTIVRAPSAWLTTTVGVVVVVLIAVALLPFLADVRLQRALDSAAQRRSGSAAEYLDALDDFAALNPTEPRLFLEAGRQALADSEQTNDRTKRVELLRGALALVDRSIALQPDEVDALILEARIFERLGAAREPDGFEQADARYRSLEVIDPHDPQVRLELIRFLNAWQKATGTDRSVQVRQEADATRAIPFSWPQGWYELARVYRDLGDRAAAIDAVTRSLALNPGDPKAASLLSELRR